MRAGRGTVGKLMTDEQLYAELNRFVASANDLTDGIKQGRGTLGKLVNDPATANALEASLDEHRDDDAPAERGRGQPRQAAERRQLLAIADVGHDQPRHAGREAEPRARARPAS